MRRRCVLSAVCILLAVIGLPVQASAGDLTLFGGFHHPGKITLGSVDLLPATGAQITDPKDFGVFGVRVNTSGAHLGFEHSLAYSPNFVDSDAWAVLQSSNLIIGVPAWISPYGTAGLGLVVTGGQGPADFGTRFAVNYGGGVKFTLAGPVGIRGDVRGYSILSVEGQTLNVVETSVGLVIGF